MNLPLFLTLPLLPYLCKQRVVEEEEDETSFMSDAKSLDNPQPIPNPTRSPHRQYEVEQEMAKANLRSNA